MSKVDINYFPFYERMKEATKESGDRLSIALEYIDFVVKTLIRYQVHMSPEQIRALIVRGQSQWDKLVGQEMVVQVDPDDGQEMFLHSINFPEMFLSRILGSAENDEEYGILSAVAKNMANFMGWGDLQIVEDID